ncbi:MAG TPA: helicase-related protein, partial [Opitutaceae bacterium]|nr:helicase-related protein [Opitutaceae bacterium]
PGSGTRLIARPSRRAVIDDDDRSSALLYREAAEFAVGHTCSAEWKAGAEPGGAEAIFTSWIPVAKVQATSPAGGPTFTQLYQGHDLRTLSAEWLAAVPQEKLIQALTRLPDLYGTWLDDQERRVPSISADLREQALRNIAECHAIQGRMSAGVQAIGSDPALEKAFRLANLAMAVQHSWDPEKKSRGSLQWWPFQLGFILLAAASTADPEHPDRQTMDLLWFPTGGGKTEAYLGLISFLAFYRRLKGQDPDDGAGVGAIMRYTLRLLTTQQFTRAASMMLACEAIRRGTISTPVGPLQLGHTPFSIGLWVGSDAVPNTVSVAAAALNGAPDQPSPKQLVHCPACHEQLHWFHNEPAGQINVRCENESCLLFDPASPLPVWTVDEDVYRETPTLLIGTIDKYAQIVRRKQVNTLFGVDRHRPPDLIVQDELHLISGPLGTIAGLYEVAIDRMFSSQGAPPKIIGSTATIRRASEQVRNLFFRQTAQFPPACLDAQDSGFAVVDTAAPGRFYCGVTTAGRSAKFTLQAVAASLLQSALAGSNDDRTRDPYWTLVSYFNSLRELGGALVLMQDDVNDSLANLAARRGEDQRSPGLIEELTSRRTQAEVRDMLTRLGIQAGKAGALDVVLATNMLSVGVDIPRLGLMLVNGQPKGMAEYIQATSRVGRGRVPGLVIAVLNNAKARDRSHYESFLTWHGTLYRDVEPTSVTPFASRARDRALHAVLVALVRHLAPGMLDFAQFDDAACAVARDLIDEISRRAAAIDPEELAVRDELLRRLDIWERRSPRSYWTRQTRSSLLQDAERAATLRAMGRLPGDAWPTLNNMRSVAERLRLPTVGGRRDA